jgi:uncharacterized protein involved in exopolysaccharide biosynthesis
MQPDDTMSLPVILAWLRVNGGKILLGGVAAMLLVFPLVYFRTKTYQSSATLLVFPPAFKATDTTPDPEGLGNIAEMMPQALPMELYRAIAMSPPLLAEVIAKAPLPETSVQQLQGLLSVELVQMGGRTAQGVQYTQALIFNARAKDPELAAKTADVWAHVFKENVDALSAKGVGDTFALLEQLHTTTRDELQQAAQALADHKKQWNLDFVQAQLLAKLTQYTKMEELLKQKEVDLAAGESELAALRGELAEEPEKNVYFRAPSDDAYWAARLQGADVEIEPEQGLRTEEANEAYVRTRLGVVEAIGSVESLRAAAEAIRAKLQELDTEIKALQTTDAERGTERSALMRDFESLEASYATVRAEYEKGRMADRTQASDIAIAGNAVVPEAPVGAGGTQTEVVAMVLGMILTAALLAMKDLSELAPGLRAGAKPSVAQDAKTDVPV